MSTPAPKGAHTKNLLGLVGLLISFVGLSCFFSLPKACVSVAALAAFWIVISEQWELRKRRGFWPPVIILAIANLVGVLVMPADPKVQPFAPIVLGIALADAALLYSAIRQSIRLADRYVGPEFPE